MPVDICTRACALQRLFDPQGLTLHTSTDSLTGALSRCSLASPRGTSNPHRQAYIFHKQQAAVYRRQKAQARVMLAAMELRVARLQERLAALRKLRARSRYAAPEQ